MTTRIPYDQWLATRTPEQLAEYAKKKMLKNANKKKRANNYKFRRGYNKQKYRQYNNSKKSHISGQGPYRLHGGVQGNILGQKYNFGGSYYTSDYNPRKLGAIQGLGEYHVKKNSLMSLIDLGQSPPRVMNTNKGEATVINHREYLGDLLSGHSTPSVFNLETYSLNPGNSSLFPFLGTIAQKFQEYEIRGMLVELKTLSSDYAAALSLGSMFMAADYNVLGAAPGTKQQLENMEYASSAKPSCSIIMPIECEPRNDTNTHLYVADDSDYEGGDKRLFDLCNIYIGSQGIPTPNTPIAEIWLTYEIALFKPIILESSLPGNEAISFKLVGTNCTYDHPLGTYSIIDGSDDRFSVSTDGLKINLPSGIPANYLINAQWSGVTGPVLNIPPQIYGFDSCAILDETWSDSSRNEHSLAAFGWKPAALLGTDSVQCLCFRMMDDGTSKGGIAFGTSGALPTECNCTIMITTYNTAINDGVPDA